MCGRFPARPQAIRPRRPGAVRGDPSSMDPAAAFPETPRPPAGMLSRLNPSALRVFRSLPRGDKVAPAPHRTALDFDRAPRPAAWSVLPDREQADAAANAAEREPARCA